MEKDNNIGDNVSRQVAGQMFGRVGKAKNTGGHVVKVDEVSAPLEGKDSVIHSFCAGCGMYQELDYPLLELLANQAGITIPGSLDNLYLETRSCGLCDGEDPNAEFKPIK